MGKNRKMANARAAETRNTIWTIMTKSTQSSVQSPDDEEGEINMFKENSKKEVLLSKTDLADSLTSSTKIDDSYKKFLDDIKGSINPTNSLDFSSKQNKTKLSETAADAAKVWRTSLIQNSDLSPHRKSNRSSVYEEAQEMITAALLIYTFADLRELASDGKIQPSSLTKHPITINKVMDAILTHRDVLEDHAKFDHDGLHSRLRALEEIEKQKTMSTASCMPASTLKRSNGTKKKEAVLAHFHDEKSTRGMVYGIAVNHMRKRVTVIFRGSVTKQDFFIDAQLALKQVNNPVPKASSSTIKLHSGFYQYLFQKDDVGRVRLEHILDDAKALLKKNKGYRLYCTGHSLGGALATLCGFYAACDPVITKNGPVVVISVASPRVGNSSFRAAFQTLEGIQLLRHLRISNEGDIVPLLPVVALKEVALPSSILAPTKGSVDLYKHCGVQIEFKKGDLQGCWYERELFNVTYAKDKTDDEGILPEELRRSMTAAKSLVGSLVSSRAAPSRITKFHSCDEYERRLRYSKGYLSAITLEQLYAEKKLVGVAVASPSSLVTDRQAKKFSFIGKKNAPGTLMV